MNNLIAFLFLKKNRFFKLVNGVRRVNFEQLITFGFFTFDFIINPDLAFEPDGPQRCIDVRYPINGFHKLHIHPLA